jgi:O-antigen/teichoic acid export membrane protein
MANLKLLKATGVYTVLGFIPLISSFVLLPIYTKYLTASDYGVVSLSSIMEGYLFIFIAFGLQSAFTIYFYEFSNVKKGVEKLLSVTLTSILVLGFLLFFFLLVSGDYIFSYLWEGNLEFNKYGWFIFANSILLALNQILFQYYRISERLGRVMMITLIPFSGSTLGGITGVIILKYGAFGSVAGKAIGTIIASLPFYFFLFPKIGFRLDLNVIKKVFGYAYPIVLIFLITNLSDTLDRFLMNKYFDLKLLGLYAFSTVIVSPVNVLVQSYWNSVTPAMFKAVSENSAEKDNILKLGFSGVIIITLLAIWGVVTVVEPVIHFIASSAYHGATYYVPLLAITMFGKAYNLIYTFNSVFYKKTKFLPIINLVSLIVGLVSALLLIPFIGVWAIFVSVILSRLSQGITAYFLDKSLGYNNFSFYYQLPMVLLTLGIIGFNYFYLYNLPHVNVALVHFIQGSFFMVLLAFVNRKQLKIHVVDRFLSIIKS